MTATTSSTTPSGAPSSGWMTDTPDDDAPTDYRPTELGAAVDETEAPKAWALAEEPDEFRDASRRAGSQR